MSPPPSSDPQVRETYLGLDLGTHALKAVGMERTNSYKYLQQTHAVDIVFERDLPHFAPPVAIDPQSGAATSDPRMFLAAVDTALERLREQSFRFGLLRAISGAAQQHGSVYVTASFRDALHSLDPILPLHDSRNISENCFALPRSPVWLDASTSPECDILETALGGPARLAEVTGSKAYERFTGSQILKRARKEPNLFKSCERILLVSSFLASIFAGQLAPEDVGDASGTNLFVVESDPPCWWQDAVNACGAGNRLCPAPVQGWTILGSINPYFQKRWGISPDAVCCAWSGDNPNTIAGYGGLADGDVVVSLGTSDTAQWISHSGKGARFGHTFRSPLSKRPEYFRMLCYANGSRTREAVRDGRYNLEDKDEADCEQYTRSWQEFEEAVENTRPGCSPSSKIAVFYLAPEIVPRCSAQQKPQVHCATTGVPATATWPELCRLSVESRAMAIAVHGARMEERKDFEPRRILVTGGGSASRVFPQILADVLNAPVYAYASSSSAAAGAALRAYHAVRCREEQKFLPFRDVAPSETASDRAGASLMILAKPRPGMPEFYKNLMQKFALLSDPEEQVSEA